MGKLSKHQQHVKFFMELYEFAKCDNAMFLTAWEDLQSRRAIKKNQSLTVQAMLISSYIIEKVKIHGKYQIMTSS